MIKKSLLFIFLCFIHIVHADQLSEAIRASDLQKVTAFLSDATVTDKQLIKYLDTAEQVIRTRRNKIDAPIHSSTDYRVSRRTAISGLLTAISCVSLMIYAAKDHPFDKSYSKFVGSMVGFGISGLSTIICSALDEEAYRNHHQNLYEDAIRIKELLYDYEIS